MNNKKYEITVCEHTIGIHLLFTFPTKCVFLCVCVSKACKVQIGSSVMIGRGKLKSEGVKARGWLAFSNVRQRSLFTGVNTKSHREGHQAQKVTRKGGGGHFSFSYWMKRGFRAILWSTLQIVLSSVGGMNGTEFIQDLSRIVTWMLGVGVETNS